MVIVTAPEFHMVCTHVEEPAKNFWCKAVKDSKEISVIRMSKEEEVIKSSRRKMILDQLKQMRIWKIIKIKYPVEKIQIVRFTGSTNFVELRNINWNLVCDKNWINNDNNNKIGRLTGQHEWKLAKDNLKTVNDHEKYLLRAALKTDLARNEEMRHVKRWVLSSGTYFACRINSCVWCWL